MRRCEDEKMRDRPPLLEEPCAQTPSGKNMACCIATHQRSLLLVCRRAVVVSAQHTEMRHATLALRTGLKEGGRV